MPQPLPVCLKNKDTENEPIMVRKYRRVGLVSSPILLP